ncbi:hypothetical protein [Marinimicrobium agarilyticum]|uniref:hypothetical protein n=1 Tax=Marinimicrobium agarilyticum TaxID=306546 RepID=UPI0003FE7202|nr:hypothetical protein [Marinimicrobium agarilyticum]
MFRALAALLPLAALGLAFSNDTKGQGMTDQKRGIRNNNPGNLVITDIPWNGKVPNAQNTDGRYEQFTDPVWGIRAMILDVVGDINQDGLNTLEKLISVYAPEHENDTAAYIAHLSQKLGIATDAPITQQHYRPLVEAIILHENGEQPYSDAQIAEAFELA